MTDAQLLTALETAGEKLSGVSQDSRLFTTATMLYPCLDELESMSNTIAKSKLSALTLVADILLTEYGIGKGEAININYEGLKSTLQSEVAYRKKLRRMVSDETAATELAAPASSSSDGCVVA